MGTQYRLRATEEIESANAKARIDKIYTPNGIHFEVLLFVKNEDRWLLMKGAKFDTYETALEFAKSWLI